MIYTLCLTYCVLVFKRYSNCVYVTLLKTVTDLKAIVCNTSIYVKNVQGILN